MMKHERYERTSNFSTHSSISTNLLSSFRHKRKLCHRLLISKSVIIFRQLLKALKTADLSCYTGLPFHLELWSFLVNFLKLILAISI